MGDEPNQKSPPPYGEQTEEMPVQPGRELEALGDPEELNAGREGAAVPKPTRKHGRAPRLSPDEPTPATGTGTSREIPPSSAEGSDGGG